MNSEEKINTLNKMQLLVGELNQHRHLYYNMNSPVISDKAYDQLFDQLADLEKSTGIILSNSPTQTVGYKPVSALKKVKHAIPLLSLDKTKQEQNIYRMVQNQDTLLMLKLDGLTIKLCYENGRLVEASTRGDGEEGELVTHNVPVFHNVPLTIPYKGRLSISGEGFIHCSDFERLKENLMDSNGKPFHNSRNLAAGSIRALNPEVCKDRCIHFLAFNVLEGLEEFEDISDSRSKLLNALTEFGVECCPFILLTKNTTSEELKAHMQRLREMAVFMDIPIDGLVGRYDNMVYSKSLGRTGHHYKDGVAFKFEDETYETIFRSIEWAPSRSGEIAPVARFDTVEIDGCEVSRASLHNLSFIKGLELYPGCRILVSKRNMIIPHIEENLDRGHALDMIPKFCQCCGRETRIFSRKIEKGRMVETLHCDNPDCSNQVLRKFLHFAERKAMNLTGISEATIEKFIELGYLKSFQDFYHLDRYRDEIVQLEGFGQKSYDKVWAAIEKSRSTTFVRYLVAMDIPMIGRTASRELDRYFRGNLREFELAAMDWFDFTTLENFGETMSHNIHEWFHNSDHVILWRTLQKELNFNEREDAEASGEKTIMTENQNNTFKGCTIVATGKLENFTRDSINSKIISLGAIAGSSVTKKTDYLICGEKAGSKLAKAQALGVKILTEQEFLNMLSA